MLARHAPERLDGEREALLLEALPTSNEDALERGRRMVAEMERGRTLAD